MAEIVMPRLSDTMEEGTILRWLKADGETVARGEELAEIETDKATMIYESDQDGVLRLLAQEGQTLPVGAPIARVGDAEQVGEAERVGDAERESHDEQEANAEREGATEPVLASGEREPRVKASPLARRLARDSGVDLHGVSGSGPGGRIVKADVEGAAGAGGAVGARATAPQPAPQGTAAPSAPPAVAHDGTAGPTTPPVGALDGVTTAKGETIAVELTRTQQTIARRMAESKATIPDFALQMDVDMEACVGLRSELKSAAGETLGTPTYNDMVVKASALALREHPRANAGYRDGRLELHARVNVGVAVAAEEALVVPTVFDADEKSLGEIARETRALAERVRAGSITPPELGGGTFTVSNLGMFGVRSFTAIVNPPQAAILSGGALQPQAVVRDGELVARHTLTLTLVCDHRILYGADAARLLARVRDLLEAPSALTL